MKENRKKTEIMTKRKLSFKNRNSPKKTKAGMLRKRKTELFTSTSSGVTVAQVRGVCSFKILKVNLEDPEGQ